MVSTGIALLPFSFAMYFPVRWLEYIWRLGFFRLVKATWYLALGMAYLGGAVEAGTLGTYICFIEAYDLVFDQLESRRERTPSAEDS
jgi:hypothetical protein